MAIGLLSAFTPTTYARYHNISDVHSFDSNAKKEHQEHENISNAPIMFTSVWNRAIDNVSIRMDYTVTYNQATLMMLSSNIDNLSLSVTSPFRPYDSVDNRGSSTFTSGTLAIFHVNLRVRRAHTNVWTDYNPSFTVQSLPIN